MTDQNASLPAVDALLEERDALHAWLAKLDASDVTVPQAVRDRVRRDYQQRLDGVTNKLRAHASTIAERLAADRAEHRDLTARATGTREALAEAELRHAVGEYDAARFEAERVRHTSDLESYELSVGAVAERITSMEELQAQLTATPSSPVAAEPPAPAVERRQDPVDIAELAPAHEDDAPPAESEPAEEEAPSADGLDTDAILSVFGVAPAPDAEPEEPEAASLDAAPLSFTPSGSAPSGPPLGMPADPPRFSPPARGTTPPSRGGTPPAQPTPEPAVTPLFATDMVPSVEEDEDPLDRVARGGGESSIARTVRCGECGAMNRPLEWYCEKCGAELTAL